MKKRLRPLFGLAAGAILTSLLSGCGPSATSGQTDGGGDASKTFVPPGEHDKYYLFYSGGHSGQVFVAGLPSLRHLVTIPVFSPAPGKGYGFDDKSRAMLGEYTWGDVHHPGLSKTDGVYDGRWLFVNDNANNRIARIDLKDFKTKQILGPIPNTSGNHGSSFITENNEYVMVGTRFSVPLPKGRFAPASEYEKEYSGMLTGIKVDPDSGEMSVAWQVLTPPFNWDLSSTGKGPCADYAFFTSYNTEMAHTVLEVGASQFDRDLGAVLNWKVAEKAAAEGQGEIMDGVQVLDPAKIPGLLHFVEIPKSPHGIDTDPTGEWVVASGKLQPTTTVFNVQKLLKAIADKDYSETVRGVPVLRWESIVEGEVPVGLGPLHTQFDGRGHGYTSLFIDSQVAKWKLPPWTDEERADPEKLVLDKIDVHYNIGHLVIGGSDTRQPYGDWLVAMNKQAVGRPLPLGPGLPETSQLIDISGDKMRMVAEAFTDKEPHFAQVLAADKISPIEVYPKAENTDPNAVWTLEEGNVTRDGDTIHVKMVAIRSRFVPDNIEAKVGDTIVFHITNVEQIPGLSHGFALAEYDLNGSIDPGETKSYTVKLDKPGVFPFYCTVFCSALHQEMQGYLAVRPADDAGGPAADAAPEDATSRRDAEAAPVLAKTRP